MAGRAERFDAIPDGSVRRSLRLLSASRRVLQRWLRSGPGISVFAAGDGTEKRRLRPGLPVLASIHVARYLAAQTQNIFESSHVPTAGHDRRDRRPAAAVLLTSLRRTVVGAPATLAPLHAPSRPRRS